MTLDVRAMEMRPVRRSRKQRVEFAIQAALRGDWERAALENGSLLDEDSRDVETANRLGKALTELGKPDEAAVAYRRALEADPANLIARKNLERLEHTPKTAKKPATGRSGKSSTLEAVPNLVVASASAREFELTRPNRNALARLESGAELVIEPTATGVAVKSLSGTVIGSIEPRAGLRLKRMIEGGNRYQAVLRRVTAEGALLYIRETYQHPSLVGQASFLAAPSAARKRPPRAYTRSSAVLRYARDDYEPDGEEDGGPDDWRPARASAAAADDDEGEDVEINADEAFEEEGDDEETEEFDE